MIAFIENGFKAGELIQVGKSTIFLEMGGDYDMYLVCNKQLIRIVDYLQIMIVDECASGKIELSEIDKDKLQGHLIDGVLNLL